MNDRMIHSEMVNLGRSLRALADDDGDVQAPPDVHLAVMRAWDARGPFAGHPRQRQGRFAAIVASGSLAAATLVAVVMSRAPSNPSRVAPLVARPPETPSVVLNPRPVVRDTSVDAHRQRPRPSRPRLETMAARHEGMVFVADPILDASATTIVRVRVPRTALATLGLPLLEPDDRGLVDLEILVGEDGVARTIRRAVPVSVRQE